MSFQGPKNTQLQGGLGGINPNTDSIGAMIMGGVSVADNYQLGTILECLQLSDAEEAGLDAAYDANNGVLVHYHISEFFKDNAGVKLYIKLVAQGTSLTAMCTDATNLKALIMAEETKREVKFVGLILNPDMALPYAPTLEGGLDKDALDAIPAAQAVINELKLEEIYVDAVIIEGREVNGTIALMQDLRELNAPQVSVMIGADPKIQALDPDYADHAAVGTVLGAIARRMVNECIGSLELMRKPDGKKGNEVFPLTDDATGRWQSAALSSGNKTSTLSKTDQATLTAKGYIFCGKYEYVPGVFLSDSPTCIEKANDYSQIEINRVWNKAVRLLSAKITPKINSTVFADATGKIAPSTIANWELAGYKGVNVMATDGEISLPPQIFIDPNQDFLASEKIKTKMLIIPTGVARVIENEVGVTNPKAQA